MKINKRALALWGLYGAFAFYAVSTFWHETMFRFSGPLGNAKLLLWFVLAGFLTYSVYCSWREDLFRSIGSIAKLHWGRQIGADLYLGLFVGILIIYLHEGPAAALIWLIPTLAFGNLSILLFVATNFDSIVVKFIGA
jgi:hypothetical protein